jgi:hypothetical protein
LPLEIKFWSKRYLLAARTFLGAATSPYNWSKKEKDSSSLQFLSTNLYLFQKELNKQKGTKSQFEFYLPKDLKNIKKFSRAPKFFASRSIASLKYFSAFCQTKYIVRYLYCFYGELSLFLSFS